LREIRKAGQTKHYAATLNIPFKNASRSALIVFGLGCGHAVRKALVDFQGAIPQQLYQGSVVKVLQQHAGPRGLSNTA